MNYREYREVKQKSFNELPIFFAFGMRQFKEAMAERGLTEKDTDKIYSLGAGGYYLRSDAPLIRAWFSKKDELPELMKNYEFAEDAFFYEMKNHEFGINSQGDWDVCSCFGDCEYDDSKGGDEYLRDMGYGESTVNAYHGAQARYFRAALDNDWF